jgi:SAM-dependent methyltransferase
MSTAGPTDATPPADRGVDPWDPAIWQEVDFGSYDADLSLWEELAERAPGPVLELGCGIGRVALALARRGHDVWGVDVDLALVDAIRARAERERVTLHTGCADVRELSIGHRFGLILAPMQLVQELDGDGRRRMLRRCADHLLPGGILAAAVLDPEAITRPLGYQGLTRDAVPDIRERDGWVLSSRPLVVERGPDELSVERLREVVSPDGRLRTRVHITRVALLAPHLLEAEARDAGLHPAGRAEIPSTDSHLGSVVVLLEKQTTTSQSPRYPATPFARRKDHL